MTHISDEHAHHHHDGKQVMNEEEELQVLMRYMINHNKKHNEELYEFADNLKKNNNEIALQYVNEAIECFSNGNEKLEKALESLKK